MKATGVVRKVDELGRVVLPIELRRIFGINENDGLEISVDGEAIVLTKYRRACVFCGFGSDIITFKDKAVCSSCREDLWYAK